MAHRDEDEWQDQLFKEMTRLAGEMSGAKLKPARSKGWAPRIDMIETESHVVLKVELAGVRADKVAVHYSATKHTLTIKGWRSDSPVFPNEKQTVHQLEIDYGEFWREVQLPDVLVKVEDVKASFRIGMMLLAIPKSSEAPTTISVRKVITIQKL